MEMKTKNNVTIKFWAKMMVMVLVVSMLAGNTYSLPEVKADSISKQNQQVETTVQAQITTQNGIGTQEQSTTQTQTAMQGETTAQTGTTLSEETTAQTETTSSEETTTEDAAAYTLIAHRGYSGYAPENSIPAIEKAVASGFKTIEIDIRRTKPDSQGIAAWVISHDDSLKNTMGVNKNISELTYKEILEYSYTKGNDIESYKDLKIVSLEEIIKIMQKCKNESLGITWQVEIKYSGDDNYRDYFEEEVVNPIEDAGVQQSVTFSSFHYSYLKKIKAIDKNLKTWFLSTILDDDAIGYATSCQAEGISFKGNASYTTKEMIDNALSKGFKIGSYGINTTVLMGAYYMWGVRQFATDILNPREVTTDMLTGSYNVKAFTSTISKDSYTYDGTRKVPTVKVTYKGIELVEGINYILSYSNNKNPGTASVYVSGINNCKDEKELTFKIVMPKVTGFKIAAAKTTYIKLSWTKVDNVSGYIVYRYNYSTKKYEAIKTITNPATITYKVKNLSSAAKYRYRVKTYVKIDGKTYKSSPCSGKTTYTRPDKAAIKSLKRYKDYKRLMIRWGNISRCTGYYVKVATDKNMKNIVGTYTVKGNKILKLKVKKLSKKKNYYVKIRAYLQVGKTKYNGVYSTVMKSRKKPSVKK